MRAGAATVGHPVNVATGETFAQRRDMFLPGRIPLRWDSFYSATASQQAPSPLGRGWNSSYFVWLERSDQGIEFHTPEGAIEIFMDPRQELDRGAVIRNLGTFEEIMRAKDGYRITRWDPDLRTVEYFLFTAVRDTNRFLLSSIENSAAHALDLLRGVGGQLIAVRQRLEQRTVMLDYEGPYLRSVSLRLSGNRTIQLAGYEHDGAGHLTAVTDAFGRATRYSYDAAHRLTREVGRDGATFFFFYDDSGRCVRTVGADGYDEKILRFRVPLGWTEVTNSLGHVTKYQWNQRGQVVAQIDPIGAVRRTQYDEHGRMVQQIDPLGKKTEYGYDEFGNKSRISDPSGATASIEFNERHQPVRFTDPLGNEWQREYDTSGRLRATTNPLGQRWEREYDNRGNLVRALSPHGAERRFEYTENGLLIEATDWMGNASRYEIDELGRVVGRTDPYGRTTRLTYDAVGNVLGIAYPDGSNVRCTYDAAGNRTLLADPAGNVTTYRFGTCRRLLKRVDALGRITRYKWGLEPRQLLEVVNEKGECHRFSYDAAGRMIREVRFDKVEVRYDLDLAGRCVATTKGGDQRVVYERNDVGLTVLKTLPNGSTVRFVYDACRNMVVAENDTIAVRFARDAVGRIISETQGDHRIDRRYDDAANRQHLATDLGYSAEFRLNHNRALSGIVLGGRHTVRFGRDATDRETERVFPGGWRVEQRRNTFGQLVERSIYAAGGRSAQAHSGTERCRFTYDSAGRLTERDLPGGGRATFAYDACGFLMEADLTTGASQSFEYDATGNVAGVRSAGEAELAEIAEGNRLVSLGRFRFVYDRQGRIAEKIQSEGGTNRTWRFLWDDADQLASVVNPEGDTWEYGYDALGRRISKRGPDGGTEYLWSGHSMIQEVPAKGPPTNWFYDTDTFQPVAKTEAERPYWVVADHLGTPEELRDQAGRLAWSVNYRAWGEVHSYGVRETECQIRFQGQWFDAESGLHYNRFRYYDPHSARYLSPDPISLLGGLNAYAYAPNPTQWIDPLGLSECTLEEEQQLREDAQAIAGQFTDEEAKRRTVAVAMFIDPVTGERQMFYAVSGDNHTPAVRAEAEARGYTLVEMRPDATSTHAEQILLDHNNATAQQGQWTDPVIAPSRPACGPDRQDCSGRAAREGAMILNPQ